MASTREATGWRQLVGQRSFWQWTTAAQLARLTPFMSVLALVIAGTAATGSEQIAGIMAMSYTLSTVVGAPINGRILDRVGPARGIPWQLRIASVMLTALAIAAALSAPAWVLIPLCMLGGFSVAGAGGGMRSLLSVVVDRSLLSRALAVDAMVLELFAVTAPLIVVVATLFGHAGGVFAMAATAVIASFAIATLRRVVGASVMMRTDTVEDRELPSSARPSLFRNPRFVFWLLVSLAFGHALGTVEVGAAPLSNLLGGATGNLGAGILLVALALTSLVGGVSYATFGNRLADRNPYGLAAVLLALQVIGCLLLAFAGSWLTALLAAGVIGFSIAPLNILRQHVSEREIPENRRAESFAILFAATGVGIALGGLALATLPLNWMFASGTLSALLALALMPALSKVQAPPEVAAQ